MSWVWLGFVVPAGLGDHLWAGKSWKLFWINNGFQVVSLCGMGAICAGWV